MPNKKKALQFHQVGCACACALFNGSDNSGYLNIFCNEKENGMTSHLESMHFNVEPHFFYALGCVRFVQIDSHPLSGENVTKRMSYLISANCYKKSILTLIPPQVLTLYHILNWEEG